MGYRVVCDPVKEIFCSNNWEPSCSWSETWSWLSRDAAAFNTHVVITCNWNRPDPFTTVLSSLYCILSIEYLKNSFTEKLQVGKMTVISLNSQKQWISKGAPLLSTFVLSKIKIVIQLPKCLSAKRHSLICISVSWLFYAATLAYWCNTDSERPLAAGEQYFRDFKQQCFRAFTHHVCNE